MAADRPVPDRETIETRLAFVHHSPTQNALRSLRAAAQTHPFISKQRTNFHDTILFRLLQDRK